jgi:hypothetical protein
MFRRYCDDCVRRLPNCLNEFEEGKYSAEFKADGYRVHLEFTDHGIVPWSRKWKKHPISKEMATLLKEKLSFPRGTILDGEWLERRTVGPETIILWDAMFHAGEWLGGMTYAERMNFLDCVPNVWNDDTLKNFSTLPGPILTVTHRTRKSFVEAFELSKSLPWTEGLVIKALDSTLVGSIKERTVNYAWTKCKWRGGSDGNKMGVQT